MTEPRNPFACLDGYTIHIVRAGDVVTISDTGEQALVTGLTALVHVGRRAMFLTADQRTVLLDASDARSAEEGASA